MAGDIARGLAAPGGMADMDCIAQIEMRNHGGGIGGVMIHVVAIAHLARTAVPAPVMSDDAETLVEKVEHLGIPIVRAQGPAVVEDDRLRISRTPVLVEDLDAVLCRDGWHGLSSC